MASRNPLDPLVSTPSASQTPLNRHNKGPLNLRRKHSPLISTGLNQRVGDPQALRRVGSLVECHLAQVALEIFHGAQNCCVTGGQDACGQQPGISGTSDGDRGHRHPGGHLHDGEQRVHPVQILQRNRNPDDGKRGERGQHPGQMRGSPCAGDDGLEAATGSLTTIANHVLGHPVRGNHLRLVGNPELVEYLRRLAHHWPIRVRSHDDSDEHHSPSPRSIAAASCACWRACSRSPPSTVTWPIFRRGATALPYM